MKKTNFQNFTSEFTAVPMWLFSTRVLDCLVHKVHLPPRTKFDEV